MRTCDRCNTEYPDDMSICSKDGAPLKAAAKSDPLLGRMVGSYRLTKQLGKGGMGAVYVGEHPAIGSKVAVKFLHPQYAEVREVVTRFFNEAKAVNLIKHDNIVQVLDYMYLDDAMPCFVMEFLDKGYAMSKLVGKPCPLQVTGPIFLQLCDALAAAHEKQIIHRDLKPDNVFLAVRNYRKHFVKVMDFGIAKLASTGTDEDSNTQMGSVLGTPSYMSPEQGLGKVDQIGPASDIYSLGIIMYQLAVGRVPFRGPMVEVVTAHATQPPPPPRLVEPTVPEAYEAIILKAIAKKPEERFASMRELGAALRGVMNQLGISPDLPPDEGESGSGYVPSPSLVPTGGARPANVGTQSPGMSLDSSGPTSYPNLPSAPAIGSDPNLATLPPPVAATPPPAPPQPVGAKTLGARPSSVGTLAGGANDPVGQATVLKSGPAPSPVASPSTSSTRLIVAAVAFAIGVALPIALVKGGVISVRPAAAQTH